MTRKMWRLMVLAEGQWWGVAGFRPCRTLMEAQAQLEQAQAMAPGCLFKLSLGPDFGWWDE